jgi:hypothetical protein
MADVSIDSSLYIRAPRISASNGVSLALQLHQALPVLAPESVREAGGLMLSDANALSAAFGVEPGTSPVSPRQSDTRVDRAWGSFESRLASWETIAAEEHRAKRERAAELHAKFFGEGLGFLKLEFLSEHRESQKRIDWIVGDVRRDLESLVQEPFVTDLLEAHAAYGVALGITEPIDEVQEAKVAEPLRALQSAIANYSLQVIAWYGNLRPSAPDYAAKVEAVRKALAPIDKFREGHAATTTEKKEDPAT